MFENGRNTVAKKPELFSTSTLFQKYAHDSAPPASGSRGSPFSGGGKKKQGHIAIQSDLPCISENRTAAMGCPVFNISVFICDIPAFVLAFTGQRPLPTVHCSLFTVHCSLFTAHCPLLIAHY